MERRHALRFRTDFDVVARDQLHQSHGRAIELSLTGILVDWFGSAPPAHAPHLVLTLELHLPERLHALRAVGRPVWSSGRQQAFRLVQMDAIDRLDLAEHLDLLSLGGQTPS